MMDKKTILSMPSTTSKNINVSNAIQADGIKHTSKKPIFFQSFTDRKVTNFIYENFTTFAK
ncbi:hypothetical protein AGMMS49574_16800 [Bacteroidia bacterium]|nr:hypothetical protein AGMMS49574_16800 [Bacteroidia bacterium]